MIEKELTPEDEKYKPDNKIMVGLILASIGIATLVPYLTIKRSDIS